MLQDQTYPPGRQQGFQRTTIEKSDTATFNQNAEGCRDQKRGRDCGQQIEAEGFGWHGHAKHLLHDEGRVSPEHDHFAMGHIDDPHHTEGDGQSNCRQQQDRSEADSEDQIFGKAKQRKPVVDPVNRLLHLSTNFGIRFHECAISRFQQSSFQQGFDFRVIAIGETTDRGAAQRRILRTQLESRDTGFQTGTDIVICFTITSAFQQCQRVIGRS